jgi:hypothetical protein
MFLAAVTAFALVSASAAFAGGPAGQPSVDWTVQDLLANPGAKAVLDKAMPGAETDPRLQLVRDMSLRTVAEFPEAEIDAAKLQVIATQLAALPHDGL